MQSESISYIDSHAHIYLPEFDADRARMLEKAAATGMKKVLMPAIDSSTHENMLKAEDSFPNCLSMIGLHPCSVTADPSAELEIVRNWLGKRKFIAIGEIGLDFYWDKTFTEQQYAAFHEQMKLAEAFDLPVCIHSRNATDECIDVVKQHPQVKGVFHCFSGDLKQAEEVIAAGWLLGIGGVVTFKNAGLDKIIQVIGIDNVILETDAPYLSPVPFRGKRNECGYIPYVIEKISVLTGQSRSEIAAITTANCEKLFRLS
jgi:TatD DNase family protein